MRQGKEYEKNWKPLLEEKVHYKCLFEKIGFIFGNIPLMGTRKATNYGWGNILINLIVKKNIACFKTLIHNSKFSSPRVLVLNLQRKLQILLLPHLSAYC